MSKLMIKATLGDDIRRFSIHNEELTYDELILTLQRVFRGKLSPEDELLLKYEDDFGSLVTIFDSADLAFALELSPNLLILTLLPKSGASQSNESDITAESLKKELRGIRNRINRLLDSLDSRATSSEGEIKEERDKEAPSASDGEREPRANRYQSKEFDPLECSPKSSTVTEEKEENVEAEQPVNAPPLPVISSASSPYPPRAMIPPQHQEHNSAPPLPITVGGNLFAQVPPNHQQPMYSQARPVMNRPNGVPTPPTSATTPVVPQPAGGNYYQGWPTAVSMPGHAPVQGAPPHYNPYTKGPGTLYSPHPLPPNTRI